MVLIFASWAHLIFRFFLKLGPPGLFLLSTLDSSFLVLPFGNDLLLVALVTAKGRASEWIVYVVFASVGSVLGALVDDLVTRKAGEKGLNRFVAGRQLKRLKSGIERRAGWAVFMATLLPPPFPFTTVIMTAAALQYSRKKLLLIVFGGRMIRFSLVAMLALYYGRKLLVYANSPWLRYFVYSIIVTAVVGTSLTLVKWLRK
jgi:membrane protein YqaA with SNARE-associated domain